MNTITVLGLAAFTVLLNGLIGHFFAPYGIWFTPVVLAITTSILSFGTKKHIKVIHLSFLAALFASLNDISIKLYSGGMHDSEGLGWITLFLFLGLVSALTILAVSIFTRKDESLIGKIIALALFPILMSIHLLLFGELGLGRYY